MNGDITMITITLIHRLSCSCQLSVGAALILQVRVFKQKSRLRHIHSVIQVGPVIRSSKSSSVRSRRSTERAIIPLQSSYYTQPFVNSLVLPVDAKSSPPIGSFIHSIDIFLLPLALGFEVSQEEPRGAATKDKRGRRFVISSIFVIIFGSDFDSGAVCTPRIFSWSTCFLAVKVVVHVLLQTSLASTLISEPRVCVCWRLFGLIVQTCFCKSTRPRTLQFIF